MTPAYDPFPRGACSVETRTLALHDASRRLTFPCDVLVPQDRAASRPLVVFSHGSAAGGRRMASYLCSHLASHGYLVAALDHFECVATDLAPRADDTPERKAARAEAYVRNRPQDLAFLLDRLLAGAIPELAVDPSRVALVGYSFGGWTVLAAAHDPRVRAVVAIAPGGSSTPKPGMLAAPLDLAWRRDVPTLLLAGDADIMTPVDGVIEILDRLRPPKRLLVLRDADHCHFLDDGASRHETLRTFPWPPALAWIPQQVRPLEELCPIGSAHDFVRGLTLAHCDAVLRDDPRAARALADGAAAMLGARGIGAYEHPGSARTA